MTIEPSLDIATLATEMTPTNGDEPAVRGMRADVPIHIGGSLLPVAIGVTGGDAPGSATVAMVMAGPAFAGGVSDGERHTIGFTFDDPCAFALAALTLTGDARRPGPAWVDVQLNGRQAARLLLGFVAWDQWSSATRRVGRVDVPASTSGA